MTRVRMLATTAGAALLLAFPGAAHSATAARAATSQDCAKAMAAADHAAHEYDQLKKELQDLVADGGHPDASQRQALADADVARSVAAARAERVCDSV